MNKTTKIVLGGAMLLLIGIISFCVRIYPIKEKGYAPVYSTTNLITARNLFLSGSPFLEGQNHIALSSEKIKKEGVYASSINQLTPFLYSKIFKYWKFDTNLPAYIAVIIWALVSVLLFALVWHLFGIKIALLFSLVEIFMPFVVKGVLWPGSYEFGMLFFTIGLMFYLWKEKQTWQELILASIFFTLACLALNAFLVSLAALFIYDVFRHKSFKRVILIIVPFITITTVFILPNMENGVVNAYFSSSSQTETFADLGHLFPDAYTYHYEKEKFLESVKNTTEPNAVEYLEKYGYKVSFLTKIKTYIFSARFYPQRIWRLVLSGGPIFIALMFAGFMWLYREKKKIFILFFSWISIWYLLLIILKTNNWDHYLEIAFPLVLMAALGIYSLITCIIKSQRAWIVRIFLVLALCLIFVGQLGMSCQWLMHDQYSAGIEKVMAYTNEIKHIEAQDSTIFNKDTIIAVGTHPGTVYDLNYTTDKNYVYFASDTIVRLFNEGNLDEAVKKMGITYFIGYGEELSWGLYQNGYKVLLP